MSNWDGRSRCEKQLHHNHCVRLKGYRVASDRVFDQSNTEINDVMIGNLAHYCMILLFLCLCVCMYYVYGKCVEMSI